MTTRPNASPVSNTPLQRWWDIPAAILLAAALLTAATRLEATRWTTNLNETQLFVLLGVFLGLMLGKSCFRARWAAFLAFCYGIILIPWRLSLLMGQTLTWEERLLTLGKRVGVIIIEILTRKPITDSLLFLIMMSSLFWALSIHAGYAQVRRAHSWQALLPTGMVLFIIHYYANCPYSRSLNACIDPGLGRGSWYLAIFLLLGLLLVGRMTHLQRAHKWSQTHTYIAPDVNFDLMRVMAVAAILMVILAWVAPSVQAAPLPAAERVYNAIGRPLEVISDWFSPLFSAIRVTIGIVSDAYGDNLTMGLGTTLSDDPILQVSAPAVVGTGSPYYWRARVYDYYEAGGWKSTYPDTITLRPDEFPTQQLRNPGRLPVTLLFTPYETISILYTASQPVWLGRNVKVELARSADGTLDMASFKAEQSIRNGQTYEVQSDLAVVTIAELRAAGEEYPEWVTERYLQLPDNITRRTHDLARRIADGKETPYDIAQAVTLFLRANIDYVEMIEPRPAGHEALDWFLFDYRKGFCQYYASAEIILLRSLGIPARMAVGYAQGDLLPQETENGPRSRGDQSEQPDLPNVYLVRQKHAHAWPEVYFPGIGWVEFEPTVSQTAINRPLGERNSDPPRREDLFDEQLDPAFDPNTLRDRPFRNDLPEEDNPLNPEKPSSQVSLTDNPVFRWGLLLGLTILLGAAFVWRGALLVQLMRLLRRAKLRTPEFLEGWVVSMGQSQPLIVVLEAGLRRLGLRTPRFLRKWAYYASQSPLVQAYLEINRALQRLGQPPAVDATPAERAATLTRLLPEVAAHVQILLSEYQLALYSPTGQALSNLPAVRQAAGEIRKQSYLAIFKRWVTDARRLAAEQRLGG